MAPTIKKYKLRVRVRYYLREQSHGELLVDDTVVAYPGIQVIFREGNVLGTPRRDWFVSRASVRDMKRVPTVQKASHGHADGRSQRAGYR